MASLPLIGALNVGVRFYLAFRVALRAQRHGCGGRTHLRSAARALAPRTAEFFLPPRNAA